MADGSKAALKVGVAVVLAADAGGFCRGVEGVVVLHAARIYVDDTD
jgi:hypothetical protein